MEIKKVLIIPDRDNIEFSLSMVKDYNCGFEYNDFFLPSVLDQKEHYEKIIAFYKSQKDMPDYCTCHGAFFDVTVFSEDRLIREVSDYRVEQSLEIAVKLGAKGVVFHTNYTPNFFLESFRNSWVEKNVQYWSEKLSKYPMLNIYMENMFDMDYVLLERLANKLSSYQNFGVCLDYAHACAFGDETEIDQWVKALGPYVKHIHINDNDFCSDLHLALGAGNIDWKKFKFHYNEYMSRATVLIETKGEDKIKSSLEFIKAL